MRVKPLVVGLAPSRSLGPDEPALVNSLSGTRLAALCGLESRDELLAYLDLVNLFDHEVPVTLDEDLQAEARLTAAVIEMNAEREERPEIIVLGHAVARAFRVHKNGLYTRPRTAPSIIRAPHPSGRSYYWNRPENVARAERFWRDLLA